MSSPIAIQRSSTPSSPGTLGSPSSSASMGGLYVPLHRRSASSSTTTSELSPSRVSLPTKWQTSNSNAVLANTPIITHPGVYDISTLLLMRPSTTNGHNMDLLMKEKISSRRPEILMTSYIGKKTAFNARRVRKAVSTHTAVTSTPAPVTAPTLISAPTPTTQRVTPRRTRLSGRGHERRRAALQVNDNWRGLRGTLASVSVIAL